MSSPLSTPRLVLRRLGQKWRLMACIFAGVVFATTLVAAAPIYLRSLERLGANTEIDRTSNLILNVHVYSPNVLLSYAGLTESQRVIDDAVGRSLSESYDGERRFLRSDTYLAGLPYRPLGDVAAGVASRGYIQHMTDIDQHIDFVDGRMATDLVSAGDGGPVVEVILGAPSLENFRLNVGDVVEMTPFVAHESRIYARIVGIFEPVDPLSDYWRRNAEIFLRPQPPQEVPEAGITIDPDEPPLPLFTTQSAMVDAIGDAYPGSLVDSTWLLFMDKEGIKGYSVEDGRDRFVRFKNEVSRALPGSAVLSGVPRLFDSFERRSFFSSVPLLLLLTLMVVTVLYYLSMMVSYLVQSREADVDLLRTRGVGTGRLLRLYALESAVLTSLAVAAAPFIAMLLIALAGKLPYFRPVTSGATLPVKLSWEPFAVAAGVGIVCLAIYVLPALLSVRSGLIGQRLRASRPDTEPFFHRYYLDVAFLAIGALVFWELQSRGSLVSGGLFQDVQVNEALLFAPVLFLIAVALVFMRFFPLVVRYVGGESPALVHLVAAGTVIALGPVVAIAALAGGAQSPWVWQLSLGLGIGAAYWWTRPALEAGYGRAPLHLVAGLVLQGALVGLYLWQDPPEGGDLLNVAKAAAVALVPAQVTYLALRSAASRTPVWLSVGLWHMARNPLQYSWLVLLLVLVTGLAVLSTTVGGTLEASQRDRVNYETAADIRVTGVPGDLARGTKALKQRYSEISGVTGVSMMFRERGTVGTSGRGLSFEIVGIETQEMPFMSWYREDFSDRTLGAMMQALRVGRLFEPIAIPEGTTSLGLYAKPDDGYANMFVWMIVEDVDGLLTTITLGRVGPSQWHLMRAAVPDRARPPLQLVSIQIYEPAFGPTGTPGAVSFDDVHAVIGGPQDEEGVFEEGTATVVLEDFEGRMNWIPLATSALATNRLTISSASVFNGASSGRFEFGKDTDRGIRGFYYSPTGGPIPVVVSDTLAVASGAGVGSSLIVDIGGRLAPVRIVDRARYFPTAGADRGGFMLADLDVLLRHLRMVSPITSATPDELLITHAPGAGDTVVESLIGLVGRAAPVRILSRDESMEAVSRDPLVSAGWKAMVLISVAVIVFTASLGYATYLLAFSGRSRGEMAALRSVGVSGRQMLALISLEHLIIVGLGLGLGTWAGFQMSHLMVSSVAVTEDGSPVVPPFNLMTDWAIMGPVYAMLVGIFAVATFVLYRSVARLDLHTVARESSL